MIWGNIRMNTREKLFFEKRWYDKDKKMAEVLKIIKTLPPYEQQEFSVSLYQLANMVRKSKTETNMVGDTEFSIGKNKVLGLYKSFNKRRWYDNDLSLASAMNSLSTLPMEECTNIAEGILNNVSIC